jgi:hypothetical protein
MGLLFQFSLSSALVGGVGRDAAYIAEHIDTTRRHVRSDRGQLAM